MDNSPNPNQPWQGSYPPPQQPYYPGPQPWQQMPPHSPPPAWPPAPLAYITERRELVFAAFIFLLSIFLCNSVLYAGFHLGFAIAVVAIVAATVIYLVCCAHRPDWYSGSLMALSLIIAAGFARSDDGFVKFVMVIFLLVAVNLSLCLAAKQNRRDPGGIRSLLDVPRTQFVLSWGEMGKASRGLNDVRKRSGSIGKRSGAVLLGLLIAIPLVSVMVFLLMRADAAFEGLMDMLPEADWTEPLVSVLVGSFAALILYTRGVALNRSVKPAPARKSAHGMNALTVNTVLGAVCLVYSAYLLSQLAYFSGGFSGILPEEFTLAEYARRGFFEMAWLCAINLGIIWFSMGLVRRDPHAPLATRLLCLFIGIVTVFLVAAASAKMFMYIESFGLTRLRVLTEVIMVFLGLTAAVVCLWLFLPKLPYMKLIMLLALTIGALTMWADVDTQVARYNVEAYRSGALETVDVQYLSTLSSGAVPYLELLAQDENPDIAARAQARLESGIWEPVSDFRAWNWASAQAEDILKNYTGKEQ